MKINLLVSYFISDNNQRNYEIETSLVKNIDLEFINKIYLFSEYKFDKDYFNCSDKIELISTNIRSTYSDMFLFVKKNKMEKDINIISNADIYFDNSILNSLNIKYDECYALTRYDNGELHDRPEVTQDAWIFKNVNNKLIKNSKIQLGIPGCDNFIAAVFKESGYNIYNPCYDIIINHIHESNIRTYKEEERLTEKELFVEPVHLKYLK